jgi:type III secretion protein U
VSDKTEAPTPRRLRKAREEGDSGASPLAAQSIAFLAAVAIVPGAVRALTSRAAHDLRAAIEQASRTGAQSLAIPGTRDLALAVDVAAVASRVLALLVPVLLVVGLAGGVAQLVQTGGVFSSARLAPTLDRLNPATGIKGLVSGARLFAVLRALFATAAIAGLAYSDLADHLVDLGRVAGRPEWTGVVMADVAGRFAWHAALAGLAIGLVDALVTRRVWLRRLRMTRDEVKREHKESEGDPGMRAARHRAYQELMAQATIASVRTASVVVVNPTHLACALRYDEAGGDEAPVVVASGEGDLAARIAQAAREWGIPIVRDVPLARALLELGVGDAIPEALYEAIAEILRELALGD